MKVTKEDVQKALTDLGSNLPSDEGSSTGKDVNKAESSAPKKGGDVPKDGDLNTSNGAADGGGGLNVPQGENMNDKYGNKKGKAKKSETPTEFGDNLPSEVETKVEVSEFLKSLVDHTANQINGLRDFAIKSDQAMEARTEEITEQIDGIEKSLSNIGLVLKAVCERIGIIENQPAVQKSETANAQPQRHVERTFENPTQQSQDTGGAAPAGNSIYKSLEGKAPLDVKKSISAGMCELVKKGELVETDVINFETYGYVSTEADTKLRSMFS